MVSNVKQLTLKKKTDKIIFLMKITKEDVVYISRLAKIKLKEEEVGQYQKNLEEILLYVEKLKTLPTEKVKETTHILSQFTPPPLSSPLEGEDKGEGGANRLRKDVAVKGLEQKDALSNAPAKKDGCFRVPKVI